MTRDELIEELTKRATACGEIRTRHDESGAISRLHGKASAYAHAAELAKKLDSPPAMVQEQQVDFGGGDVWTVTIVNGVTTITDATGFVRHRSNCHESTAVHLAMSIKGRSDPPAMAWQDAPSKIGLHYVEGLNAPVPLIRDANKPDRPWVYWDIKYNRSERVGKRRVCPVPAPPALPKRGDT